MCLSVCLRRHSYAARTSYQGHTAIERFKRFGGLRDNFTNKCRFLGAHLFCRETELCENSGPQVLDDSVCLLKDERLQLRAIVRIAEIDRNALPCHG
jgi:hypothetical protein